MVSFSFTKSIGHTLVLTFRAAYRRALQCAAAAAVLCACAACGDPGNSLDGSLGEQYELTFDRVRARLQGDDLVIDYLRDLVGGDSSKVCKLVVDTRGLALARGARIAGATFVAHVAVKRVAPSGGDFPPLQAGSLEFAEVDLVDGAAVHGRFEAVFASGGRTLNGTFDEPLEELDLGK